MATHPITRYTSSTGFSIELKWGFIINEKVDIIVNTTTSDINLHASPLKECMGSDDLTKFLQECRSKAPLDLEMGEYVVTGSGEKDRYIYHGCVMDGSGKVNLQDYLDFIKECFEIADTMNCKTIAVPVLEMKSFSQSMTNSEKKFAMELSKWYKSTLAEDALFGQMHLCLVVTAATANSSLYKIYTDALTTLNKPNMSGSGTSLTSDASRPNSATTPSPNHNTFQYQFDDSFEILQMTQSLRPGTHDGTRPKELQRRNSSEGHSNKDVNKTQKFPSRRAIGDSVRSGPDSRSGANVSDQKDTDVFQNRNTRGNSARCRPQSSSDAPKMLTWTTNVYKGDITAVDVDAIVHGTTCITTSVDMNGVVGRCIKAAGGATFERQCGNLGADYTRKGLAVTGSGKMKFKNVIHVSTSSCKDNFGWQKLISNCLEKADNMKLESVAFPAIGAAKVKDKIQATNFKDALDAFSNTSRKYLKEVHIVLHNDLMLNAYTDAMEGVNSPIDVYPSRKQTTEIPTRNKSNSHQGAHANTGQNSSFYDLKFSYKNVQITIKEGDVTKEKVECIVHGFWYSGAGYSKITLIDKVGQALEKMAGNEFKQACDNAVVPRNYIQMTPGFRLCNKVMHVEISGFNMYAEPTWEHFMRRCLGEADNANLSSIAIPAIGTLSDPDKVTQLQIAGLKGFIDIIPGSLKDIRVVIYNDTRSLKAFKEAGISLRDQSSTSSNNRQNVTGGGSNAGSLSPKRHMMYQRTMNSYKGIEMQIVYGDLTKEKVDAIVHVTNKSVSFMGKAGDAIQKVGGEKFKAACLKASFDWNKATLFSIAGELSCSKVLHLDIFALKKTAMETKTEQLERMKHLIHECLVDANSEKLKSLAFPAIGTGKYGCDPREIARCFKEAIGKFCVNTNKPHLKDIRIVIFESSMVAEFIDVLKI